jgi:hypothetical protein
MTNRTLIVLPESADIAPVDMAALRLIQDYGAGELPRFQARADKWSAGLVAIAGVLATATVIKGPQTLADVQGSKEWVVLGRDVTPTNLVVALMVLGGVCLAVGIYLAYRAANGSPLRRSNLDKLAWSADGDGTSSTGAAAKWLTAVRDEANASHGSLTAAVLITAVGFLSLVTTTTVAAAYPAPAATPTQVCIKGDQGTTALKGSFPTVTTGQITIVPC